MRGEPALCDEAAVRVPPAGIKPLQMERQPVAITHQRGCSERRAVSPAKIGNRFDGGALRLDHQKHQRHWVCAKRLTHELVQGRGGEPVRLGEPLEVAVQRFSRV